MKKTLTIISVFIILNSFSQVVFNRIDSLYSGPTMRNVVIQNDGYISVGGSSDSILGVVVRKNDLYGEIVYTKYYGDTIQWYHGVENSLKATGTGNYILGGNRGQSYSIDNLLIKFDSNFDTIFTKRYYPVADTSSNSVITVNTNIDTDGNYLLVGTSNIDNTYNPLQQYSMQLIKTDTFGNLLWRKTYGNSTYTYYGYKVVPAFGGGYILGGWCSINGGDNCLIKVDENGENPQFFYFGHPTNSDGRVIGITKTKDTCYVITASVEMDTDGNNKAHIFKLDSNFNIIWDKLYLNYGAVSDFLKSFEKPNGNLIVHGGETNTQNRQQMVIMELTASGDSLWKQTTTSYDTTTTHNYMESGKLTPDGGMVFAGWTTSTQVTPYQQMWLVKTDSMGCDGTEWTCDVSYLEELASNNESGLLVYPNPVTNSLTLSLSKREGTNELQNSKSILQNLNTTNTANLLPSGELKGAFNSLTINQKLKYNIAHPDQKLWTEKEEQEMRELSRKFAYAFPFEVIKGKVDIFAIDPALNASVITYGEGSAVARNEARMTKQSVSNKEINFVEGSTVTSSYRPRNDVQEIVIYDIFGKQVLQQSCHSERSEESLALRSQSFSIDVSKLQKGVYFVQVGNEVAKFVKE